jgi:hypothetical protein
MAVTITHTQTRSVEAGPTYVVHDVVTDTAGIDPEVFVFVTDDDSFNRIATVDDMLTLPATSEEAIASGADYYRLAEVTRSFASLSSADNAAIAISDRLKLLVVDFDAATNAFIGTTTETLSS